MTSSPATALQRAQIRAQEGSVRSSRAWWLPTLGLNVDAGRSEVARGSGGAFLQPNPSGGWDQAFGVSLNFPDLGRYLEQRNSTERQQLTVLNSEETLRQVALDVEQDVRSVLVQLRSDHAALALQQRRVDLAQERLSLRLESYRLGRGTFQDLQSASEAAAQAERALLTNRYNLELRLTQLEQTFGMPLERIVELGRN
jgi:outer membrane protein TolC